MKKFGIIVGKWGKFGWGFYLEDSKYIYYMYFGWFIILLKSWVYW